MSAITRDKRLTAIAILQIIGVAVSVMLSNLYYSIRSGTAGFSSFCNLGDTMNCDAVAASSHAELFWGVPISSVSAGVFLAGFFLALIARSPASRRESVRMLIAMNLIGAVFSLYLLAVMAFTLRTWCILCLVLDVVVFGTLILSLSLKPGSLKSAPIDWDRWKTGGWLLGGSLLIMVVLLKAQDSAQFKKSMVDDAIADYRNAPAISVGSGPEFNSIGPADAPITIVEFSDLQCPYCRMGAVTLSALKDRYPGKVRVVLRNFPLDPACNPKVTQSMHPAACDAAKVLWCSGKQGKFEPVYEAVFEEQANLKIGYAAKLATDRGVDAAALEKCLKGSEVNAAIARDIDEGVRLNIQGTPAFFMNGKRVQGLPPLPVWGELVEHALPGK